MAIYLQSRGISQDCDYRWLKLRENSQVPEIPPVLKRPIPVNRDQQVRVSDLIDSQMPSIVLARSDGELLLLVTGLAARAERTDFMGRRIRNSIAWVYPDSNDNERIIRSLAIRALIGDLEAAVDQAVNIGGEYGFEVALTQVKQLAQPEKVASLTAESPMRIGGNSPEFKQALALELEQHCLTTVDQHRLLVVVTGIKSKEALLKARVWRGLSSRFTEQTWLEQPDHLVNAANHSNQRQENVFFWVITIAAIALILIFLIATGAMTLPQLPKPQALNPAIKQSSSLTYSTPLVKGLTSTKYF